MDYSDWGAALAQAWHVNGVNYGRLLSDLRPLERFLVRVQSVGPSHCPDQFTRSQDRLAYLINVHNATVLRAVCELSRDGTAPSELPPGFDSSFRFLVDGRLVKPVELRGEALRLAGDDWRVRLAMCEGYRYGPPLPRRVLLPDLLDGQLNEIVRQAIADRRVVTISHGESKRLLLCEALYEVRRAMVEDYERRTGARGAVELNALLDWLGAEDRQTLNAAVGYDVAVLARGRQSHALEMPPPAESQGFFSRIGSFTLIRPSR